jgi:hypothetical protein
VRFRERAQARGEFLTSSRIRGAEVRLVLTNVSSDDDVAIRDVCSADVARQVIERDTLLDDRGCHSVLIAAIDEAVLIEVAVEVVRRPRDLDIVVDQAVIPAVDRTVQIPVAAVDGHRRRHERAAVAPARHELRRSSLHHHGAAVVERAGLDGIRRCR